MKATLTRSSLVVMDILREALHEIARETGELALCAPWDLFRIKNEQKDDDPKWDRGERMAFVRTAIIVGCARVIASTKIYANDGSWSHGEIILTLHHAGAHEEDFDEWHFGIEFVSARAQLSCRAANQKGENFLRGR